MPPLQQSNSFSVTVSPTSSNRSLVDVHNLHVSFDTQDVLRDVTLRVRRGETVAIIGESGCGKTVLLKSIIGLIRPTSGSVHFDGNDLASLNDRELTQQRARFGYVFQNAALFDSLTVGQNVAFPLRQHRGYSPARVRDLVLTRLAMVGLPDSVVSQKPAELSGGMRKRVGLARALIMNPELILYDEPTTGLDPIMSDVINELMLRTKSENENDVTSIIVTHDMRTAHKVADRIIMVFPLSRLEPDEPQLIFDGAPEKLDHCADRRVSQFINGEAGERLTELQQASSARGL
ncbi:MAG: ABC transporter ATP-binding protein [Planctomycetaceae bacterium]|nr:ABC transporter ATP-binding protein [Planctomycetaceae bacterium]